MEKIDYCDICINTDEEKRSGVCATCKYNRTYASHFKASKQVSRIMEANGIKLEDIIRKENE